jgi:hypothetical protein
MPWAETGRWWVWEWLFSRYCWYRHFCGGHWEQWWNEATCSEMWFQMDRCSLLSEQYRPPCCKDLFGCEDHE